MLGEEHHISMKAVESSDGMYIQYESDGNAYFKALLLKNYLMKMVMHFIDIVEELKRTISSW